jgi:hypothetical protein
MSDEGRPTPSALQVWAAAVMSGGASQVGKQVGDIDRAPGQAHYDPADVISVFMSARESAKQRHVQARRTPPAKRGEAQPS